MQQLLYIFVPIEIVVIVELCTQPFHCIIDLMIALISCSQHKPIRLNTLVLFRSFERMCRRRQCLVRFIIIASLCLQTQFEKILKCFSKKGLLKPESVNVVNQEICIDTLGNCCFLLLQYCSQRYMRNVY